MGTGLEPVFLVYFAISALVAAGGVYYATKAEQTFDDVEHQGLRINTRDTSEPIKVLYGKQRLGGNDVFIEASGKDNKFLWSVMTLCEGPIEGLVQDADGRDEVFLGNKQAYRYSGDVRYWLHTGTGSQTYDTNLHNAKAKWTDAMRYTAYIVFWLKWDEDKFQGFPKRTLTVKGRLLYDPRDETTSYSTNPALATLDWMMNNRYGMGINASKLNMESFGTAASYCEAKGWEINMAISKQDRKIDVLNNMLALFRGCIVWNPNGGQFYLKYADLNYEASAMTIEDQHIIQDTSGVAAINIAQGSKFQKPVGYNVVFIDPTKDYTSDKVPVGETMGKVEDLQLLGCTDRQHATDIGIYTLERNILDRIINLTARDDCIQLEPNDVCYLNSSSLSISDQLMRVVSAKIEQSGLIQLSLQYESTLLYDDDYNIELDDIYQVDLPDPTTEPPGVINVVITEQIYAYRLRSESRFLITFDEPLDYLWFDHVDVYQSFDNLTWEYLFPVKDDFYVGPLEEGQTYYFRLKVVNTRGVSQQDNNDWKISKMAIGQSSSLPPSLTTLYAIITRNNGVTLFSQKINSPDIEVYEFRLGQSWSGGIFLASLRSPNLVYNMVKPGNHIFYCNTLGANGLYGASPVSAYISLPDPPDDYTVQQTKLFNSLVTNGDMELDSNWASVGSPTENIRTSVRKNSGVYSRKFTVDAQGEGIRSDTFTTVSGRNYGCTLFVNPDDTTSVLIQIRKGDNSGYSYTSTVSGLTQDTWNEININFVEGGTTGGVGAYIEVLSPTGQTSGSWFVDDVVILEGNFSSNVAPVLYNGDAYIKCKHTGGILVGTWYSPIIDLGSSDKYLVYSVNDIVIVGAGTLWNDQLPAPVKWSGVGVTTRKWREIFELTAAPSVEMTMKFGTASPPTSEVKKLEILAAIVTGRYYQLKVVITDPQNEVNVYCEGPNLKFTQ